MNDDLHWFLYFLHIQAFLDHFVLEILVVKIDLDLKNNFDKIRGKNATLPRSITGVMRPIGWPMLPDQEN